MRNTILVPGPFFVVLTALAAESLSPAVPTTQPAHGEPLIPLCSPQHPWNGPGATGELAFLVVVLAPADKCPILIRPPLSHTTRVAGEKCSLCSDAACQIFCVSPTPTKPALISIMTCINLCSICMLVSPSKMSLWVAGQILTCLLFSACNTMSKCIDVYMYVVCI